MPDTINPLTGRPFSADIALTSAMNQAFPNSLTSPTLAAYKAKITDPNQPTMTTDDYAEPMAKGVIPPGNLTFRDHLQDLQQDAADAGNPNVLISGNRDPVKQAKLYANYIAGKNNQPLPNPELGPVKMAAPSGSSPHEFGVAGDVSAADQPALDALARQPWRGITPGSDFGDPGHYQASVGVGGGGSGIESGATKPPVNKSNTNATQPAPTPPSQFNPKGLYTLAMLQAMFPQHRFSPVDYDPFKVMPQVAVSRS